MKKERVKEVRGGWESERESWEERRTDAGLMLGGMSKKVSWRNLLVGKQLSLSFSSSITWRYSIEWNQGMKHNKSVFYLVVLHPNEWEKGRGWIVRVRKVSRRRHIVKRKWMYATESECLQNPLPPRCASVAALSFTLPFTLWKICDLWSRLCNKKLIFRICYTSKFRDSLK